jgi:hypothetical protein
MSTRSWPAFPLIAVVPAAENISRMGWASRIRWTYPMPAVPGRRRGPRAPDAAKGATPSPERCRHLDASGDCQPAKSWVIQTVPEESR